MGVETEAKLAAGPDLELPPLGDVIGGVEVVDAPPMTLDARYFDAADLRLLRAGITLRHRTGEGGADGAWTAKLDVGGPRDGVARREEQVVPGPIDRLPGELAARVRPWLRSAPLVEVAHLRTTRRPTFLATEGEVVGEVDDDEVSVLVGDDVSARFREIEVETRDGDLLDRIVAALRDAGAGAPDPVPKIVRALGPAASEPPDVISPFLDERSRAGDVLQAGIASAVLQLVSSDGAVRAGTVEGIHKARVACRRLRSDLRTFRSLVEDSWAEPLRGELRWLAGELGAVRDRDVLRKRLVEQIATLPDRDAAAADDVLRHLDGERAAALSRAIAAIDSDRYLQLLDALVDAAARPPATSEARRPALDVVPDLAGAAFRRLRRHVRRLPDRPSDEDLHDLRIQAKRARYAADVALPVVGTPAKRYTRALSRLQDVLGELHDCYVADEWLHDAATTSDGPTAFVLGELAAKQREASAELRTRWRPAWKDASTHARTGWMG